MTFSDQKIINRLPAAVDATAKVILGWLDPAAGRGAEPADRHSWEPVW